MYVPTPPAYQRMKPLSLLTPQQPLQYLRHACNVGQSHAYIRSFFYSSPLSHRVSTTVVYSLAHVICTAFLTFERTCPYTLSFTRSRSHTISLMTAERNSRINPARASLQELSHFPTPGSLKSLRLAFVDWCPRLSSVWQSMATIVGPHTLARWEPARRAARGGHRHRPNALFAGAKMWRKTVPSRGKGTSYTVSMSASTTSGHE